MWSRPKTTLQAKHHNNNHGYVNKQNCRFRSEDQPGELQKLPIHSEKVTIWCGFWASGIIGPYFHKDAANRNVIVNRLRYREKISHFYLAKMQELDLHDLLFQQDGATYHTARARMDLLTAEFGERFVSRSGPVNWPPRSCDLYFFLWGYVKAHVYTHKPA